MTNQKTATLELFFNPKSITVIGVSSDERAFGSRQLNALLRFGYKGRLYPVNPNGGEFFGLKAYSNVRDIPDDVDLAIITVPAHIVSRVLADCLAKGIKAAEVLSAGFRELGNEGLHLEKELQDIAARGIKIIGPNCFGVYSPAGGVTILPGSNFPRESGAVALLTQSGQFSEMIVMQARGLGIRFSKVISYGNACDLNEADFLEYLAEDADTKVIQAYIEGVRDGRRFLDVARRVSRVKPIIVWKVGLTSLGSRAASTHTGSLGGSEAVWNAFLSQSGAISVTSLEELIDTTLAFLHLPTRCGSRVALVSGGGGGTVVGGDACQRVGLILPVFTPETETKLGSLLPRVGASVKNPVDIANPLPPSQLLKSVLEVIAASEEIDVIILRRIFLSGKGLSLILGEAEPTEEYQRELMNIPRLIKEKFGKPVIVILHDEVTDSDMLAFEADRRQLRDYYLAHGIPVYPTLERAIKALANLFKHL